MILHLAAVFGPLGAVAMFLLVVRAALNLTPREAAERLDDLIRDEEWRRDQQEREDREREYGPEWERFGRLLEGE